MIPEEARILLSNMRSSMSETIYLDMIWSARDHQQVTESKGKWPFIRACDRTPEAKVDVLRLPAKIRGQ